MGSAENKVDSGRGRGEGISGGVVADVSGRMARGALAVGGEGVSRRGVGASAKALGQERAPLCEGESVEGSE